MTQDTGRAKLNSQSVPSKVRASHLGHRNGVHSLQTKAPCEDHRRQGRGVEPVERFDRGQDGHHELLSLALELPEVGQMAWWQREVRRWVKRSFFQKFGKIKATDRGEFRLLFSAHLSLVWGGKHEKYELHLHMHKRATLVEAKLKNLKIVTRKVTKIEKMTFRNFSFGWKYSNVIFERPKICLNFYFIYWGNFIWLK